MECPRCKKTELVFLKSSGLSVCRSCGWKDKESKLSSSISTPHATEKQISEEVDYSYILQQGNLAKIQILAGEIQSGFYELSLSPTHESLMLAVVRTYQGFIGKTDYVEYVPYLDLRNNISAVELYAPGASKDASETVAGGLAGAVIGGALFGDTGAIVGAVVGSEASGNTPKVYVKITFYNGSSCLASVDVQTMYFLEELTLKRYDDESLKQGDFELLKACEISKNEARKSAQLTDGCASGCAIGCMGLVIFLFSGGAAFGYALYQISNMINKPIPQVYINGK